MATGEGHSPSIFSVPLHTFEEACVIYVLGQETKAKVINDRLLTPLKPSPDCSMGSKAKVEATKCQTQEPP